MTLPVEIFLTWEELSIACHVGLRRQLSALVKRRTDAYGAPRALGWELHIQGAAAECAVAKYLGVYWSGDVGNIYADDVSGVQVRSTAHVDGRLILHDQDKDAQPYVLAVGTAPRFELVGWCLGRDGKRPEYVHDPQGGRPAYFVPRDALSAMDLLKREAGPWAKK